MKKAIKFIAIIAIGTGAYLFFFTDTFDSTTTDGTAVSADSIKADTGVTVLSPDTAKKDTTKK